MSEENNRFILRLWMPALLIIGVVGIIFIAALTSGDPLRVIPTAIALVVAPLYIFGLRWWLKRRLARALRSPDPSAFARLLATAKKIPYGAQFAAANSATAYALWGRVEQAETALQAVSWHDVPPIIEAQRSAARAVLAYVRGDIGDGLDEAVAATQQSSVEVNTPGAATSELAFRTLRNLGLALAGRATETTERELRTAHEKLPLLGQIYAAWGLAEIAKRNGATQQQESMLAFIREHAPHFTVPLPSSVPPPPR